MSQELTQPPTEMITRIFPGGKGGRCVGLTTLPPSCADCLEIWEPQPNGALRVCPGLSRDCCTFLEVYIYFKWHFLPKGVSFFFFFFLSFFLPFWQRSANTTSKYKGEFPIWTFGTSWYRVRFWRFSSEMFCLKSLIVLNLRVLFLRAAYRLNFSSDPLRKTLVSYVQI